MSLKAAAQHLAAHGRNGDTTLVHMTPREVHGLQQLAKAHGKSLTVNPHTGLPEAFDIGDIVEKAAPIAAAYFLGPEAASMFEISGAAGAGLAAGATGYAMTGDLNKGLQAGLLAYGGAGLGEAANTGIKGAEAAAAQNAAATANEIGAAEAAKIAPTELTTGEAFKAGTKGISSLGVKDLAKYGGAALYGSGLLDPKNPDAAAAPEGYIRPKYYDYRTQTYYDLPAVKAKDWGGRSFDEYRNSLVAKPEYYADGGLMENDQDLVYQNDPVVRMADGGSTSDAAAWWANQPGGLSAMYDTINKQIAASPNATDAQIDAAMKQSGISMQDVHNALQKGGGSQAEEYAVGAGNMGLSGLNQNINSWLANAYTDPGFAALTTQQKQDAARAAMGSVGMNEADVERATGKTVAELFPRTPVVTTPLTYAPAGTTNPYGNGINPGDITANPDKSRTITPNIPGRPYGGFTGMSQVRDAYTAGGGNLGQVLAPTRTYQNTGASADAYGYLFGDRAWPSVTQPRAAARNTVGNTTSKYIWKDNMLVLNPDYVDTALAKAKTTTTADDSINYNAGAKDGGLMAAYAHGGETHLGDYSDGGRLLRGPGDGVSDSIPATIGGKQPARLADGEFVVPARIVSEIGNGSTEAGARKLYAMMDRVQKARGKTVGKGKVAKNTRADKYLPG